MQLIKKIIKSRRIDGVTRTQNLMKIAAFNVATSANKINENPLNICCFAIKIRVIYLTNKISEITTRPSAIHLCKMYNV